MLRIRQEQWNAIQAAMWKQRHDMEEVVSRILRDLREVDIVGPPDADDGSGELSPAEKELRLRVREDVDRALLYGVVSMDGLAQCVSYRFLLSPSWDEDPEIKEVLMRPGLTEYDRLMEVHQLVM